MVIEKGKDWGETGRPAPDLRIASSDRQVSRFVARGIREFVLAGGDMARTIGATRPAAENSFRRLSVDLVRVSARDGHDEVIVFDVFSHVLIRRPLLVGGALNGGVTALCNAQFLHGLDVAPRSHPNDGRFEIIRIHDSLGLRQRLLILSRMRTGSHLPHPGIRFEQSDEICDLDTSGVLEVDGRRVGFHRVESVKCFPDHFVVWIAVPPSRQSHAHG